MFDEVQLTFYAPLCLQNSEALCFSSIKIFPITPTFWHNIWSSTYPLTNSQQRLVATNKFVPHIQWDISSLQVGIFTFLQSTRSYFKKKKKSSNSFHNNNNNKNKIKKIRAQQNRFRMQTGLPKSTHETIYALGRSQITATFFKLRQTQSQTIQSPHFNNKSCISQKIKRAPEIEKAGRCRKTNCSI